MYLIGKLDTTMKGLSVHEISCIKNSALSLRYFVLNWQKLCLQSSINCHRICVNFKDLNCDVFDRQT